MRVAAPAVAAVVDVVDQARREGPAAVVQPSPSLDHRPQRQVDAHAAALAPRQRPFQARAEFHQRAEAGHAPARLDVIGAGRQRRGKAHIEFGHVTAEQARADP